MWSLPSGLGLCLWIWNPVGPAVQFSSLGGYRWRSGRGPLAEVGRPGARVISCLVSLTAVEHGVPLLASRGHSGPRFTLVTRLNDDNRRGSCLCVRRYELQREQNKEREKKKTETGLKQSCLQF